MNNLLRRYVLLALISALPITAQENPSANMEALSNHLWNKFKDCVNKQTSFLGYNRTKEALLNPVNPDTYEVTGCALNDNDSNLRFVLAKTDTKVLLRSYIHRTGDSQIHSDPTPQLNLDEHNSQISDTGSSCAYLNSLSSHWNGNPDLLKRFKNYSCDSELTFEEFTEFMKK